MIDDLLRNWYLLMMLVVGLGLTGLGYRWSEQERRERQDSKKKSP